MKIEIRIERLALHGMPAGSAARLGAALERELTRLVRTGGVPATLATDAHCRRLQAPGPRFRATTEARLARGLAQNLYRSLAHIDRPNPVAMPVPPTTPASPARR